MSAVAADPLIGPDAPGGPAATQQLLADYQAYVDTQDRVSDAYRDEANWTRVSILNAARVGRFSSDRSIADYCRQIWNITPGGQP